MPGRKFTQEDYNKYKAFVEEIKQEMFAVKDKLKLNADAEKRFNNLFDTDPDGWRNFYKPLQKMDEGISNERIFSENELTFSNEIGLVKGQMSDALSAMQSFGSVIGWEEKKVLAPIFAKVIKEFEAFDKTFDPDSKNSFKGVLDQGKEFVEKNKPEGFTEPWKEENYLKDIEDAAEEEPEEQEIAAPDKEFKDVIIDMEGVNLLQGYFKDFNEFLDKHPAVKAKTSNLVKAANVTCDHIKESLKGNETTEANELQLNLHKLLQVSISSYNLCEKENEKDFIDFLRLVKREISYFSAAYDYDLNDDIDGVTTAIENYEETIGLKQEANQNNKVYIIPENPEDLSDIDENEVNNEQPEVLNQPEIPNQPEAHEIPKEHNFNITYRFTNKDRRVLTATGSDEYTLLCTSLKSRNPSAGGIFDASWNYLRRKDSTPWTTEGKRRVESAARVMADMTLTLLSTKQPVEMISERLNAIKAEGARNPTFRNILIDELPKLANENCACGELSAELYGIMKFFDFDCRLENRDILISGKMNKDPLKDDMRYNAALQRATINSEKFERGINASATIISINNNYNNNMKAHNFPIPGEAKPAENIKQANNVPKPEIQNHL